MSAGTFSTDWFKHAQAAVNADPGFRKRGSIDVKMGVKVGGSCVLVTFAGFSCHGVADLAPNDTRDADFMIEMTADQWQRFLEGRRSAQGRTLAQIDATDNLVKSLTPRKKLEFLRFHTSLQAFFDAGVQANAAVAA